MLNGGFSAISEAFFMNKPMVVVPVPGHAEQWTNAQAVDRMGVGITTSEEGLEEAMFSAINRIDQFRGAYKSLKTSFNGAKQAAEVILNFINRSP